MKPINLLLIFFFTTFHSFGQQRNVGDQIDSLFFAETNNPFNGVILIAEQGQDTYKKVKGYSDLENKVPLKLHDQFVIGSISKQFTAVLVLQEYDKGNLDLFIPIRHFLPDLTQDWADTVTVHHLLTHTHGIAQLDKPTTFAVGTRYAYSQIGYDLLAQIVEKTSGTSFATLSQRLFETCGMNNTFHPDIKKYNDLVKGYTETEDGHISYERESFENYAAAGSFVSTASDLNVWNDKFYSGQLLKTETMDILKTKQKGAVRNHPIFGITAYGYGFTIDTNEGFLQYGQTGFAPGFVSMNFFFPETKTSVIVLENIAYDTHDFRSTFGIHTAILKMVRNDIKIRR
ncbi:MAG TPA: serine hydrolase domain-containing protein [Saprospiraceae bacterium]|nr:serine hydrolase domain-containing protein [Saprospiraceae bacterium]